MYKGEKKHNWMGIVTIKLSDDDVAEMHKTGMLNKPYSKNNQEVEVGCYDCELGLSEAYGKPCVPVED